MASIRRHLASLGLAVVLCHVVMQVLVPAVLCCQQVNSQAGSAETDDDCCAGTHPGQVCPMHRSRGTGDRSTNDCNAQPQRNFLDLLVVLTTGVVAPSTTELVVTLRFEAAFVSPQHVAVSVPHAPLGPPPRA